MNFKKAKNKIKTLVKELKNDPGMDWMEFEECRDLLKLEIDNLVHEIKEGGGSEGHYFRNDDRISLWQIARRKFSQLKQRSAKN